MRRLLISLALLFSTALASASTLNFRELSDRARDLNQAGRAAEAEALAREALVVAEGNNNPRVSTDRLRGVALSRLGQALRLQGRHVEAENVLRESITKIEREFGKTNTLTVSSLLQLGMSIQQQGRYQEADSILRDAVTRSDNIQGESPNPPEWFSSWSRSWLCNLDQMVGRYEEAEALCHESIRIAGDNPRLVRWRHNSELVLARMWLRRKQLETAEEHARRAADLTIPAWGAAHSVTADTYSTLAKALYRQGKLDEAEIWMEKALPIVRHRLGKDFGGALKVFTSMGELLEQKGDLASAEDVYREALQNNGNPLGRGVTQTHLLRKMASLLSNAEREHEAVPLFREAMDQSDRMFAQTSHQEMASRERLIENIRPIYNLAVRNLIYLHKKAPDSGVDREALATISRTQSRIFTEMLRQTSVAQQADNRELAELRVQLADAMQEESRLEAELVTLAVKDRTSGRYLPIKVPDDDLVLRRMTAQVDQLVDTLGRARSKREQTEKTLWEKYPSFMELTDPKPVTVDVLQKTLLKPDETLLSYYLLPKAVAIFLVTRDQFKLKVVQHSEDEVAALVKAVRKPSEDGGRGSVALRQLRPADLHALYNLLIKPMEDRIPAHSKVLVVGDGPLYTLPFEMLVSRWGDAEQKAFDEAAKKGNLSEYGLLSYAGNRNRFSYLPSLAALAYQRSHEQKSRGRSNPTSAFSRGSIFGFGSDSTASSSAAKVDFMAFADPVFDAPGKSLDGGTRSLLDGLGVMRSGRINIPRLPETADEAKAIATILGGKSAVFLREDAQESRAKKADLRGVRYLHFATHGLLGHESGLLQSFKSMNGNASAELAQRNLIVEEIDSADAANPESGAANVPDKPTGQPALLMTLVGDLHGEDGLLTMGEVIDDMKLDADLVVLSACNTAGEHENTRNGEGFAGLTRAFMHAGAKGLLVSHWSVESQSTRDLMVEVFQRLKAGKDAATALAEAQSAMRASTLKSAGVSRAHPFFWAPFVFVGD